jgi:hypothetical protein
MELNLRRSYFPLKFKISYHYYWNNAKRENNYSWLQCIKSTVLGLKFINKYTIR